MVLCGGIHHPPHSGKKQICLLCVEKTVIKSPYHLLSDSFSTQRPTAPVTSGSALIRFLLWRVNRRCGSVTLFRLDATRVFGPRGAVMQVWLITPLQRPWPRRLDKHNNQQARRSVAPSTRANANNFPCCPLSQCLVVVVLLACFVVAHRLDGLACTGAHTHTNNNKQHNGGRSANNTEQACWLASYQLSCSFRRTPLCA